MSKEGPEDSQLRIIYSSAVFNSIYFLFSFVITIVVYYKLKYKIDSAGISISICYLFCFFTKFVLWCTFVMDDYLLTEKTYSLLVADSFCTFLITMVNCFFAIEMMIVYQKFNCSTVDEFKV